MTDQRRRFARARAGLQAKLRLLLVVVCVTQACGSGRTVYHSANHDVDLMSAVDEYAMGWPEESRALARGLLTKYGSPDSVTQEKLVWHNRRPWTRTAVYRAVSVLPLGQSGPELVEQSLPFVIPPDFLPATRALGVNAANSVTLRDHITVWSHTEGMSFLIVNVIYDVVNCARTVADARDLYVREAALFARRHPARYTAGLLFSVPSRSDCERNVGA